MAIDSRNKRASALNSLPILIMPSSDGVIDGNDRQQMTWLYSDRWITVVIIIVIRPPVDRTQIVPYSPRWFLVDDEMRCDVVSALTRAMLIESDERVIRVPPESRSIVE